LYTEGTNDINLIKMEKTGAKEGARPDERGRGNGSKVEKNICGVIDEKLTLGVEPLMMPPGALEFESQKGSRGNKTGQKYKY